VATARTRRQFLRDAGLAGVGLTLLGAGCSSDSQKAELELVRLFSSDKVIVAGTEQRLPFGLVDNGSPVVGEGSQVDVRVLRDGVPVDEVTVPSRLVNHDHPDGNGDTAHEHADIVRYFPLRTTLPEPGIYDLEVLIDGQTILLPVQAFAPDEVDIIVPGAAFPRLVTPTLALPGPMKPLCTLFDGPCPFHQHTVADVLDAGDPLAFLIATPAFCRTAYCGPVLQTLIESAGNFPSIQPIHLEVYENPREVDGNLDDPDLRLVAAFGELGLTFEPSLFLVGRDGVLADRIDNVFDRAELELALAMIA
jgi:hypothetical protein